MSMTALFSTFETNLGPFTVAVDPAEALVATAFGGPDDLRRQRRDIAEFQPNDRATEDARRQVVDYLSGARAEFELATSTGGTAFQQRVWQALVQIPRGATRSYGDLARELQSSPRAVGRAVGTNPLCLVVPCHRVIGADGSLTGFAFGVAIKQRLLELEGWELPQPDLLHGRGM
jgi:methylated-DNA-[protein]-cysteine S-methyltransferase